MTKATVMRLRSVTSAIALMLLTAACSGVNGSKKDTSNTPYRDACRSNVEPIFAVDGAAHPQRATLQEVAEGFTRGAEKEFAKQHGVTVSPRQHRLDTAACLAGYRQGIAEIKGKSSRTRSYYERARENCMPGGWVTLQGYSSWDRKHPLITARVYRDDFTDPNGLEDHDDIPFELLIATAAGCYEGVIVGERSGEGHSVPARGDLLAYIRDSFEFSGYPKGVALRNFKARLSRSNPNVARVEFVAIDEGGVAVQSGSALLVIRNSAWYVVQVGRTLSDCKLSARVRADLKILC